MATFTTDTTPEQVVDVFEAHLRRTQRHAPDTPGYSESPYSRLIEALIVAWFSRKAFVEHYWQTDTRAMLVEWLSPAECSALFAGDDQFIEGFRRVLRERAHTHLRCSMAQDGAIRFEYIGALGPQYRDIDLGIIQTNPTEVTLVVSALCDVPHKSVPVRGSNQRDDCPRPTEGAQGNGLTT